MPTLNKDEMYPTLATIARATNSKGEFFDDTVEILSETNEILADMVMVEANKGTTHEVSVRNGLPKTAWNVLYKGIPPSVSSTTAVKESIGMLGARSLIDQRILKTNKNSAAWLRSEQKPFIEAMNKDMAEALWYNDGNIHPERFMGFAPRYSDLSAPNGANIIDAGGTDANNTSIWLVVWSPETCHGLYPEGSTAGVHYEDIGINTIEDDEKGRFEVHEGKHEWSLGLCVRDWRYVVRIANIDVTKLRKDLSSGANLPDLMADAIEMVPNLKGRPAFYMNRNVRRILRGQIEKASQYTMERQQVGGHHVTTFGDGEGIPVRVSDALLSTEERVK